MIFCIHFFCIFPPLYPLQIYSCQKCLHALGFTLGEVMCYVWCRAYYHNKQTEPDGQKMDDTIYVTASEASYFKQNIVTDFQKLFYISGLRIKPCYRQSGSVKEVTVPETIGKISKKFDHNKKSVLAMSDILARGRGHRP